MTVSMTSRRDNLHLITRRKDLEHCERNSRGILSISLRNLLLISSNMSFLLISVLFEPDRSAAVEARAGVAVGAKVVAPVGSAAAMASALALNRLNFMVRD